MVTKYEADIEEQAFTFQCAREGKEPRWIRVYSPHVRCHFKDGLFILCLLVFVHRKMR